MCKRGKSVRMTLPIGGEVDIDKCIAPIIKALNDGGIITKGCCCRHGKTAGYIHLANGHYLRVFPNRKTFMKHSHEAL